MVGFTILVLGVVGRVKFLTVLVYWHTIRLKYNGNPFVANVFRRINGLFRRGLSHPKIPGGFLKSYDTFSGMVHRYGDNNARYGNT